MKSSKLFSVARSQLLRLLSKKYTENCTRLGHARLVDCSQSSHVTNIRLPVDQRRTSFIQTVRYSLQKHRLSIRSSINRLLFLFSWKYGNKSISRSQTSKLVTQYRNVWLVIFSVYLSVHKPLHLVYTSEHRLWII